MKERNVEYAKTIGEKITKTRIELGWNMREAAKACNMKEEKYRRIEHGIAKFDIKNVILISKGLQTDANTLLNYDTENKTLIHIEPTNEKDINKIVGTQLKKARKKLNLTPDDILVKIRCKTNRKNYEKIEDNEEYPDTEMLLELCKILHCCPNDLCGQITWHTHKEQIKRIHETLSYIVKEYQNSETRIKNNNQKNKIMETITKRLERMNNNIKEIINEL